MKIAITGGTGLVGWHLAEQLLADGHEVIVIARHVGNGNPPRFDKVRAAFLAQTAREKSGGTLGAVTAVATDLSDTDVLSMAFGGCDAVAHCAGINRELGAQTYQKVHIDGTRHVVEAARRAGVTRIALMSFLRARPECGSAYHESKWAAEEIVRNSGLQYTILKAGMVYGRGDHMLDHLSHAFHTFPLLATVGFREKAICPLAIEDLVRVMQVALVDSQLPNKTIAITGAEELLLSEAARRVADVVGRRAWIFPAPVIFDRVLAQVCEWAMNVPLVAKAQVQILVEGVVEPATPCDPLPADLMPTRRFTAQQIRRGLPEPGPFGLRDLRCCAAR